MRLVILLFIFGTFLGCSNKSSKPLNKISSVFEENMMQDVLPEDEKSESEERQDNVLQDIDSYDEISEFNANLKIYNYNCDDGNKITAQYMSKNNEHIAIVDVPNDGKRVFIGIMSNNGDEYVSGEYIWLSRGETVYFSKLGRGDIVCSEVVE